MKAKVTEVSGELFVNDELFDCTTTLAELKEMYDNAKIWKEVKQGKIQHDTGQYLAYLTLMDSPRKYTIEDIEKIEYMIYNGLVSKE